MNQSSPPWRVFDAPSSAQPEPGRPDAEDRATVAGGLLGQPIALAGIAAALVVGGLAVVVATSGSGTSLAAGPNGTIDESSAPGSGAVRAPVELVVDVAGAVVTPGVYRLAPGSRMGDAIDAAGGFGPRVDAERAAAELNLAATLTDGQQIRVPSRDEQTGPDGGSGGSGGAAGGGGAALVKLNQATQAELESLPGIGPVTAAKIIESRTQTPFKTVDDLRERGLVGEKTFASLRALVTVG